MGDALIGAGINAAVGIGTAVVANSQAEEQEQYMQDLTNVGTEQREMIEGIDKYFLGGGSASGLDVPGFADQFGQLDYMREEQEGMIDEEIRNSRQLIEDTMPSGGAKLRALADLSIKSQDAKNKINQEYEAKTNDLDVSLTNQYLQGAMGRQSGVPLGTQYGYGMQGLVNTQNQMGSIGQSLGSLAGSLGKSTGGTSISVTPGTTIKPVSAGSTLGSSPSEGPWGGGSFFDEDFSLE